MSESPAMQHPSARWVEELLFQECRLLDEGELDEWLLLFTEDAHYWVPARPGDSDPTRHVSHVYDDRSRMGDRVWRLAHGPAHSQIPPSSTSRIVGNVEVVTSAHETAVVRSKFAIVEVRSQRQRTFAGSYEHHLRNVAGEWLISMKKVLLVSCEDPLYNLTFIL